MLKTSVKKYSIITLSQIIVGIGVGFVVKSGMGNDPLGVMVSGISKQTGVSFCTVSNLVALTIVLFMLLFYRKRLSLTTLISALVIGWTVDPVVSLLSGFNVPVIVNNIIYPIVGCLILSVGVGMCLAMNYGAASTDNLILMICDFTNKPYSFACTLCYIMFFAIGFVLKGVWGYATLLSILLNGRLIDFFTKQFDWLNRWTEA